MITVHSWGSDGRCKHCLEPRGDHHVSGPRWCSRKPLTTREAARARRPLDGADAQALEAALAGVERLLGNLLADLHGDGGHYVRDHGLEQACDHAHVRLAELRERLDRAEAARDASRDLHERAMTAIHEAAGIKRDGLAAILAFIEEARESNAMACENTPTRGCECPGCGYAREKAR